MFDVSRYLTNVLQTITRSPMKRSGPADLGERKERILHTRVPPSLDHHLKRRARSLGMSVSTVVRHVLLNTFGLVEDIVTDSTNIALAIAGQDTLPAGERGPAGGPVTADNATATTDVLGWQEAVLNRNAVCDRCNAILRKGLRAAIGVRDGPGPRPILCRRCLGRLEEKRGTRAAPPHRPASERG